MEPVAILNEVAHTWQQHYAEATKAGETDIQKFYRERVVFVTGGSGFLGKQLIEKLLRSCNVSKIYVLMRPKKGIDIQERLGVLGKDSVFDVLREQQPDFADKIVAVAGDISKVDLGLSDEDWKTLTEEIDVIFHVAATTKFDETLRVATMINLRGVRECLKLGKACKKLSSYVHVSTSYTHGRSSMIGKKVFETFYESPLSPEAMISMAEEMDDERLERITPRLIKDWPNTYTFTKALAEELIRTTSDGLPICIIRPGAVICSQHEPAPAWLDQSAIFSATGVLAGILLGVLHAILVRMDVNLGLVPCDFTNNAVIAAGREAHITHTRGGNKTVIYSLNSAYRNIVQWQTLSTTFKKHAPRLSTPMQMYYAYVFETKYVRLYEFASLFMHTIPAYIVDNVSLLLGKERRFVKMDNKVKKMTNYLSHFMLNDWSFVDDNTVALYNNLSKEDQIVFNFDVKTIKWTELAVVWLLGIRKYIFKDGFKHADLKIDRNIILRVVHYVFIIINVYLLWKSFCFVCWLSGLLF